MFKSYFSIPKKKLFLVVLGVMEEKIIYIRKNKINKYFQLPIS